VPPATPTSQVAGLKATLVADLVPTPIPTVAEETGSPLFEAAKRGDAEEVGRLLSAGTDVNERTAHGWTALMMAAGKGQRGVVELLLAKGADPKLYDPFGATALMRASEKGDAEIVKALLRAGA